MYVGKFYKQTKLLKRNIQAPLTVPLYMALKHEFETRRNQLFAHWDVTVAKSKLYQSLIGLNPWVNFRFHSAIVSTRRTPVEKTDRQSQFLTVSLRTNV